MTQQHNSINTGRYLDEFASLELIQPSAEWTNKVATAMLGTVQKKEGAGSNRMLIPGLLFIVINGLLLFSINGPVADRDNTRQQTLEQVQEELFIQSNPVN